MALNGSSPRVLVIDGNSDYRAVISRCVELAGAQPEAVNGLGLGMRRLAGPRFDLVIWGVAGAEPKRVEGLAQLRETGRCALILLDESYEEARKSFEAGADQLLPKPFVPGALVGAIKAALRGSGPNSVIPLATKIEVRGVVFDSEQRTITNSNKAASLTRREWELLSFFLANPNQYFSAPELLRRAWQTSHHSPEQLRSYVARLRGKLGPLGLPCDLLSQQGRGYCLAFEAKL